LPGKRRNPKHTIDRGAPASVIADKFGGGSALARALGKQPSTVQRWILKGHIAGDYHAAVNDAAKRLNIKLKPTDFVDTRKPEERPTAAPAELAA
jgi:hypothetical protein